MVTAVGKTETGRRGRIFSVTELNKAARGLLEDGLPPLWVEGELSNIARPSSGHMYFTLKDAGAQVRCAMFRARNSKISFEPEAGQHVLAHARVSLYEPRGDYQLIVQHLEEAGEGALRRAFEELKRKLSAEGLFDEAHKQELPELPKRIGIVTSPSGAAVHDVINVLARRFPAVAVRIYPTAVQGEGAAEQIAAMIELADSRADCDVLIVCRGGGSLEDLWAFNEEIVARAIYNCEIPVIAGVGHEVDVTIADFTADLRAPTPSGAAELAVPDYQEWLGYFSEMAARLAATVRLRLERFGEKCEYAQGRLARVHPRAKTQLKAQKLDELERRLLQATRRAIERSGIALNGLRTELRGVSPRQRLRQAKATLALSVQRLAGTGRRTIERRRSRFSLLARSLNTVSPLATLDRGYAIVIREDDGAIVRDATQLKRGDRVTGRLARGEFTAEVERAVPTPQRGKQK